MKKIFEDNAPKVQGFYISATKRNSGKTTISIAIMRLLRDKGLIVQPFKKGPDFIDPMWLKMATGVNCYNLDFYFMSKNKIIKHFLNHSQGADISIVEGNHGLYDSLDLYGNSSNAALAKFLNLPVILVVDVGELNRSVIPVLLGFKNFDENVKIKGLILNKVHSKRHEKNLMKAINYYTDFKVVGQIPNDTELSIKQRHLGLVSTLDRQDVEKHISNLADKVSDFVDLDAIVNISGSNNTKPFGKLPHDFIASPEKIKPPAVRKVKKPLRVGIAYDSAFNFYYDENIESIENLGCDIVKFSPISDSVLPDVDAIYIGGGFPEIFCEKLEENATLRTEIREKIECGLPVYAECGGLMYLCKSITYDGKRSEMVGVIPADVKWTKKPKGHGYTRLESIYYDKDGALWFNKIKNIKGHEFHHSYLEIPPLNGGVDNMPEFAFSMKKGYGVNGINDGIVYKNMMAGYTHIFSPSVPGWFKNWISFVKEIKKYSLKIK